MTDEEMARERELVDAAPELSDEELQKINSFFPAYFFRRKSTGEFWTTCCHRHGTADREVMCSPVWTDKNQREPKNSYSPPTIGTRKCPLCGARVIIKDLGKTGNRNNLWRGRRAMVLRWDGEALWARAYECMKCYENLNNLTGFPRVTRRGVYRFMPGKADGVIFSWYDGKAQTFQRQDGPLTGGRWKVKHPFYYNAEFEMGCDLVGLEELKKSPLRYCGAEAFMRQYDGEYSVELLTACCIYPRQIEMLMKAGLPDAVWDLVARGVKNAAVIDWTKTGPDAVRIGRQELKRFLHMDEDHRNVETLRAYRRYKGRFTVEECASWVARGLDVPKVTALAKEWNVPEERIVRYLVEESGDLNTIATTMRFWTDYLQAAQALGEPMHRENVLMPRPLGEAHNRAVERQMELRGIKGAEAQRRIYEKRRKALERKYAYSAGGIVIRIPRDKEEIKQEGIILKHCVGGYADRHINGNTTILFMRQETAPEVPWLTIEMNGNKLVQIHGYRNEGLYTAKGRFAPDPREVYREWLDKWLQWLEAGSPRSKDGTPKEMQMIDKKIA